MDRVDSGRASAVVGTKSSQTQGAIIDRQVLRLGAMFRLSHAMPAMATELISRLLFSGQNPKALSRLRNNNALHPLLLRLRPRQTVSDPDRSTKPNTWSISNQHATCVSF